MKTNRKKDYSLVLILFIILIAALFCSCDKSIEQKERELQYLRNLYDTKDMIERDEQIRVIDSMIDVEKEKVLEEE